MSTRDGNVIGRGTTTEDVRVIPSMRGGRGFLMNVVSEVLLLRTKRGVSFVGLDKTNGCPNGPSVESISYTSH